MLVTMTTNEPPVGPDPQQPGSQPPPPPPPSGDQPPSYPPPGDQPPAYGSYGGATDGQGGGYAPPPSGGLGSDGPFSATDAIAYGWRKFSGNVGNWIIAGLIVFAVFAIFAVLQFATTPTVDFEAITNGDSTAAVATSAGSRILALIVSILASIASMIITGIAVRGGLDETEGRRFSIGDAISRVPMVPVVITSIVIGLAVGLLGAIPLIGWLLALVVQFFTWFALPFVVDKQQDAFTAIQSSFSLVGANVGNSVLLALLSGLLFILGFCTCGLGLLVVYPIIAIATAYAFRRFQNEPVAA